MFPGTSCHLANENLVVQRRREPSPGSHPGVDPCLSITSRKVSVMLASGKRWGDEAGSHTQVHKHRGPPERPAGAQSPGVRTGWGGAWGWVSASGGKEIIPGPSMADHSGFFLSGLQCGILRCELEKEKKRRDKNHLPVRNEGLLCHGFYHRPCQLPDRSVVSW